MNRNQLLHFFKQQGIINPNNSLHIKFNKTLINNPRLMQLLIDNTSFLRVSACAKVRLHTLIAGITEQPVCAACKRDVSMRLDGVYRYTFPVYCSSGCFSNAPGVQLKRLATNIKKYGASSFSATPEGRAKTRLTNMERYGVESTGVVPAFMEKRKQTNLERYGVEHPASLPHVVAKRKQTNLERYGVENAGAPMIAVQKRKQTNLERCGVESVFELTEFQEKADNTMMER